MTEVRHIDPEIWASDPGATEDFERFPARGYPYPTPKDVVGCTVRVFADNGDDFIGVISRELDNGVVEVKAEALSEFAKWDAGEGLYRKIGQH